MKVMVVTLSEEVDANDPIPGVAERLGNADLQTMSLKNYKKATFSGAPAVWDLVIFGVDEDTAQVIDSVASAARISVVRELPVIVVTADISPNSIHKLLQAGAQTFVPWPFPAGALEAALKRIAKLSSSVPAASRRRDSGRVISVMHATGGVGASTIAVNLAWEMTDQIKGDGRIALLDFDFQYGAVACALDLPDRVEIDDLFLSEGVIHEDVYLSYLCEYRNKLTVQTGSPNLPPIEGLDSERIGSMIDAASSESDVVVIDMPLALASWSEAVLERASAVVPVTRLGVREARNMSKLLDALRETGVNFGVIEPVLNFAPTTLGVVEKSKARKFEQSIGVDIRHWLPDGGREAGRAIDDGAPLAEIAKRNPLRAAIRRMAKEMLGPMARATS